MAWSLREHLEKVLAHAKIFLKDVRIIRYDIAQSRAIIDVEGVWKDYRIIISIKQKYGLQWKAHLYTEVPHQHDSEGNLTLTPLSMTSETFVTWITDNL